MNEMFEKLNDEAFSNIHDEIDKDKDVQKAHSDLIEYIRNNSISENIEGPIMNYQTATAQSGYSAGFKAGITFLHNQLKADKRSPDDTGGPECESNTWTA